MHIKMQHAICRHAISLNIILVKPTKCTLSKMHKMHIGILIGNKKAIPESRWIYG